VMAQVMMTLLIASLLGRPRPGGRFMDAPVCNR
jgi:hypothetical protein